MMYLVLDEWFVGNRYENTELWSRSETGQGMRAVEWGLWLL
jgi:hypothetical protein